MINVLDLFSGIGGFALASSWVGGYRTLAFCEIEGFCRDLLKQNFPGIPIFEDVKELHPEDVIRQGEPVHLITAGFPCQDISVAGVRKGIKGGRSGLFFEILRLSDEFYAYSGVRPALLLENVPNLLSGGGGEWARIVHGEVASRGYDCEWKIVSAASVGAPHLRKRWWCIAYVAHSDSGFSLRENEEIFTGRNSSDSGSKNVADSSSIRCSEGTDFRGEIPEEVRGTKPDFRDQASGERSQGEFEPGLCGVASRIPNWIHEPDIPRVTTERKNRVNRLKSLGNSIVPQVAMIPLIRFREIYEGIEVSERA